MGLEVISLQDIQEAYLSGQIKQLLINIARKSRRREIRDDVVPINENAKIGPNYNDCLMNYVYNFWDISRAKKQSESLMRAIQSLNNYKFYKPR